MESIFLSESKTEKDSFFSSHIPQIIKSLNANIVYYHISTGSAFKGGRSWGELNVSNTTYIPSIANAYNMEVPYASHLYIYKELYLYWVIYMWIYTDIYVDMTKLRYNIDTVKYIESQHLYHVYQEVLPL